MKGAINTNTYYTKCGREFKKSTKADTTGYTIIPEDKECADCQFQVDVKKGWPPVHDKWECRAGSKPPNHKNEWSGSTEDKNTIHIKSLDNDFLESIIEYCKGQPDLGAGYNQDLPDCRRTVSVSCSSNKKGMAAKKALIEKFFGQAKEEIPEKRCELCAGALDEGESVDWIKCTKKMGFVQKVQEACEKFEKYEKKEDRKVNLDSISKFIKGQESENESTNFVNESSEIASKEPESVTEFDYSSMDNETATFLQEKANKIVSIRTKAMIDMAIELEEVHNRLSNHYQGSFCLWCESIGISDRTARNYLSGLNWVRKNFPNIEDAKNIQTSLLFAAAKQDAPEDLQKAVLSGDITSNKEYQEALKAKAEAEQKAKKAIEEKEQAELEARQFERKWKVRETAIEAHKQSLDEEKKRRYQLELDLKRAQEKGDSEEVKSLQHEIENYQTQIGSLNVQMQKLEKQLKDKPIEVSATKVVEKLPDEIMDAIYKKVSSLYESILRLTETEIQVFAQAVDPDQYDYIVQNISDAIGILNNIDTAVYEVTKATNEAAAATERKTAPCEDCQYCTWEGLKEEDENAGKVICKMYNALVENEKGCRNFAER